MQVKLHVHFLSYLHQLDSGILTESCFQLFRGWALGKFVIILGISFLLSLPVQISHHGFFDSKQAYSCTAKFLLFIISWTMENC